MVQNTSTNCTNNWV